MFEMYENMSTENAKKYLQTTFTTKVLGFDPNDFKVEGHVRAGFEPVQAMFEENFRKGKEESSQLCVYYKGEKVVDLWGSRNDRFGPDSLLTVFSSSKSLTAIVIALLVDAGHLSYSQLISDIWPEFTGGGKEKAKVADLMRHELGLPGFSESLVASSLTPPAIKDNLVGRIIEQESLKSSPGTVREYHFFTRGWIANEVVRRADPKGRTIGEILKEEVSDKLEADAYIGLKPDKIGSASPLTLRSVLDVVAKVATQTEENFSLSTVLPLIGGLAYNMLTSKEPSLPPPLHGIPIFRLDRLVQFFNHSPQVEIPSANANCSARGLAKIGAMMANRGSLNNKQILTPAGWASMHSNPTQKKMFGALDTRFSRGGVNIISFDEGGDDVDLDEKGKINKYLSGFVGWMGLGGSIFQWQPRRQVGFAYIPSLIDWTDLSNSKGMKLQACVVECIEKVELAPVLWLSPLPSRHSFREHRVRYKPVEKTFDGRETEDEGYQDDTSTNGGGESPDLLSAANESPESSLVSLASSRLGFFNGRSRSGSSLSLSSGEDAPGGGGARGATGGAAGESGAVTSGGAVKKRARFTTKIKIGKSFPPK